MAKKKNAVAALPPAEPDPQALVPATREAQPGFGEQVVGAVTGAVRTVRDVLPARRLPVYLAGAALAVTGILEAPAVIGLGLGYEALRRWDPARRG